MVSAPATVMAGLPYGSRMDIGELLRIEHQGWGSLCAGTGADFYGRIMTKDAVMVLAHGFALDRDAVIASLNDAPTWDRYEITDERLTEIDDSTAILVYRARASRGEQQFHALMSSVYTRHDGLWRLAHYQQTPVTEEGG